MKLYARIEGPCIKPYIVLNKDTEFPLRPCLNHIHFNRFLNNIRQYIINPPDNIMRHLTESPLNYIIIKASDLKIVKDIYYQQVKLSRGQQEFSF